MKSVAELEAALDSPSAGLIDDMCRLDGDILVIGAGGKLGPSLTRLAANALREAGSPHKVIAASRFGKGDLAQSLEQAGATVIAVDVTDDAALNALPDAPNVIYLVGAKFGSTGREAHTWYTNTYLPGRVAERFKQSRIVALSTGNVYPFASPASGGPTEVDPVGPVGDYAMSCLGRERIFSHFAEANGTKTAIIRLNYAVEMRYGVLVDIARAVHARAPVDVSMGAANVVWQGYANEVVLRALSLCASPAAILNVAGPEIISVRQVAAQMAKRLGVSVEFTGSEAPTALLNNAAYCHKLFGYPQLTVGELADLTIDWVAAGLPLLDKPTGFQKRDGKF
jgi:nucleoside-diphosphate-sugar epimerase